VLLTKAVERRRVSPSPQKYFHFLNLWTRFVHLWTAKVQLYRVT
jgi:hypothetical protein